MAEYVREVSLQARKTKKKAKNPTYYVNIPLPIILALGWKPKDRLKVTLKEIEGIKGVFIYKE